MASNEGLVQFIAEQMQEAGSIRYRKMMGEYCLYCNEKVIGLVCDDRLFLKVTPSAQKNLDGFSMGCAYDGAKPSFIFEDIDNRTLLTQVVREIAEDLPLPKKKKRKRKSSENTI